MTLITQKISLLLLLLFSFNFNAFLFSNDLSVFLHVPMAHTVFLSQSVCTLIGDKKGLISAREIDSYCEKVILKLTCCYSVCVFPNSFSGKARDTNFVCRSFHQVT